MSHSESYMSIHYSTNKLSKIKYSCSGTLSPLFFLTFFASIIPDYDDVIQCAALYKKWKMMYNPCHICCLFQSISVSPQLSLSVSLSLSLSLCASLSLSLSLCLSLSLSICLLSFLITVECHGHMGITITSNIFWCKYIINFLHFFWR